MGYTPSWFFKSGFQRWTNAIILSLDLSDTTWFLSLYSIALITAIASCSYCCSTKFVLTNRSQLSANDVALHISTSAFTSLNISLRYIVNRTGKMSDICRTHVSMPVFVHRCLLMTRLIILSVMNESVHRIRSPPSHMFSMIQSRQFLLTWFNTPLTSISTILTSFLSGQVSCTGLNTLATGSMTLLCFLDSIWLSLGRWFN